MNSRHSLAPALLALAAAVLCIAAEDSPPPPSLPLGPTLSFDSEEKTYDAIPTDTMAPFTIWITNVWTNYIVINQVRASCHCTVATLPANPWVLTPGESGAVTAHVDLSGKDGTVRKTLTFITSVGERVVTLTVNMPPEPRGDKPLTDAERKAAMQRAIANPRAIFQGDCATCHVDKAHGLLGQDLYAAACGICHESPNRASLVPDLHALKQQTGFEYWKNFATYGKPHTMMPGFAVSEGGPLSDMQILSLATYLNHTISHNLPPH